MTYKIQCQMVSEVSHKANYPQTHKVWHYVRVWDWPDADSVEAAQFMLDSIGVYEHGEADLPRGISLEQYAKVTLDLIEGWYFTVKGRTKSNSSSS